MRKSCTARATAGLDVLDRHTPHRPYIDAVTDRLPGMRYGDDPRAGCGQPLAGRRHRVDQHAALPHRSGFLAQVVSRQLDQRIVPGPVPQLVLFPAGDGNRHGAGAALPAKLQLRHAAG